VIEESNLIQVVVVAISASVSIIVALIAYFKLKELEMLKHKLTEERFIKEKWWDERKSLYIDLSKATCDLLDPVVGLKNLFIGEKCNALPPSIFLYSYNEMNMIDTEPLESHFSEDTETLEIIRAAENTMHPRRAGRLIQDLINIQGRVILFASSDVDRMYGTLLANLLIYRDALSSRLWTLGKDMAKKSKGKFHSEIDRFALNFFSMHQRDSFFAESSPQKLSDLEGIIENLRKNILEIHIRMKEELSGEIPFLQNAVDK